MACALALAGCSSVAEDMARQHCDSSFRAKAFEHHVVGFYPAYKHDVLPISEIRWDMLTRVVYSFGIPRADGTVDFGRLSEVDALVAAAHANGVEAYVSTGGGSGSENFIVLAQNADRRRTFVETVTSYIDRHCLDGIDVDWEHWTKDASNQPVPSESAGMVALLQELRASLGGLGISIDVYAGDWNGRHYPEVHSLVDQVQVMAYDFSGPWSDPGPHSSFEQAIGSSTNPPSTGLAYWTAYRGWPKEKILLGVPFYGRDFDDRGGVGVAYRDILRRYPDAADRDRVANIYYNGPQTIADKAEFVVENRYPGIMIWEISHDTRDPATSLLHAISAIVNP